MSSKLDKPSLDRPEFKDRVKVTVYGDNKIDEAKGYIEQMRRQTDQTITRIKTDIDQTENLRRNEEEKKRKERANKIQNEVITSHKKNVEIDWNWQELEEKEDCKELAEDIEVQIAACKKIIEDKELLTNEFKQTLIDKDKHYVNAMKDMTQYIDELIRQMSTQFVLMRDNYSSQLSGIEEEFSHERESILKRNADEIARLFDLHKKTEEYYAWRRNEEETDQNARLEAVRSDDANNQADQKIKLEKEMQILEKCMEDMKAVYRLNEEKLEFNKKVLQEREMVNKTTKAQLRIRKRTYDGRVREVKLKFEENLKNDQIANYETTKTYRKFTEQFKKLQEKFERFEQSDDTRMREVWQMNESEAKALVEKIMHADKVIHMQQLNIPWRPPTDAFFSWLQEKAGVAGGDATLGTQGGEEANSATQGNSMIQQTNSVLDSANQQQQQAQQPGQQSRSEIDSQSQNTANAPRERAENADTVEKYAKIKNVFRLLINEAEYLIDDHSFERCEGVSLKEQFSIKIDSIRKSLGIDNMDDVELLVETMYLYEMKHRDLILEQKKLEEVDFKEEVAKTGQGVPTEEEIKKMMENDDDSDSEAREPEDPLALTLDPDLLTLALNTFHKTREDNAVLNDMPGQEKTKAKKTNSNFETEEQKAERQKRKQQIYWEKMTTILSGQKQSVWKALSSSLSKYYKQLVERQNLIEETGLLNQQNEELKTLLNQYLQAGVNQELQVPPTQVIRLDI